jgi:complex III assembly factor LYRM7
MLILEAELRIHGHTERGDNDTVKMPNGQTVVIDGKTCADR